MTREDADKRVKTLVVTESGLTSMGQAFEKLAPDFFRFFSEWAPADLERLQALLERMKVQLDEARD